MLGRKRVRRPMFIVLNPRMSGILLSAALAWTLAACDGSEADAIDARTVDANQTDGGGPDLGGAPDLAPADAGNQDALICRTEPHAGDVDVLSETDLVSLRGVSTIDGYLFFGAPALQEISGLECLQEVTGNLVLVGNTALQSLAGLSSLKKVGGKLYVEENERLVDLQGLEGVDKLGLHLEVYSNAALVSIDGLETVTSVGGVLHIYGNAKLANLEGLAALQELGMGLQIRDNPALPTCAAQELWDRLTAAGWTGQLGSNIIGNDDQGSCE